LSDILRQIDNALERKGMTAASASRLAVGNPALIKNMRAARDGEKRFNAVALMKLAEVLDLEFYFGPERQRSNPGFATPAADAPPPDPTRREALTTGFLPIPYHAYLPHPWRGVAPVALSRRFLDDRGLVPDALSFVPVQDTSMEPELSRGSLVLTDSRIKSGANGRCVAALLGLVPHVGYLSSAGDGAPCLLSPQGALTVSDPNLVILGAVVWATRAME